MKTAKKACRVCGCTDDNACVRAHGTANCFWVTGEEDARGPLCSRCYFAGQAVTRRFHLGHVLSITGDKLLAPNGVSGIYEILNFMTGDTLYTHQLPRCVDECRPYLLAQFPQLEHIDDTEVTAENWREWLAARVGEFGEWFDVAALPPHAHARIDPLSELAEMVHPAKIIEIPCRGR